MKRTHKRFSSLILSLATLIMIIILLLIRCSGPVTSKITPAVVAEVQKEYPFIHPPLTNADIVFTSYQVKPARATELIHSSGSHILIPAHAFIDKNGKTVQEPVTIFYREMHNPWDIMVSGIPMTFQQDSIQYHFESAGMFEIKGTVNNEPVYIKKGKDIHVEMVTQNRSGKFNNYYLDTLSKRWVETGRSLVKEPKSEVLSDTVKDFLSEAPQKPLIPRNADSVVNILLIQMDNRKNFPEFDAFQNLKFEVVDSHGQYKAGSEPMKCSNPNINPSVTKPGYYDLQMLVHEKTKSYWISWLVRPAFKGDEYKKAMDIYASELVRYRALLKKQEEQRILAEKERRRQEKFEQAYRVMNVSKFGIYNSDSPLLIKWQEYAPKFVNAKGEKLEIRELMIIDSTINGVIRFDLTNSKKIMADVHSRQKLVGIGKDTLLYACITCENEHDFTTSKCRIKMQRFNNAEELKEFVEK